MARNDVKHDQPVIVAKRLTKRYGSHTAVDGLDLSIAAGEVFGLLGPNGAGKTTTILMLLGLTEPTAGDVRVLGFDPVREPLAVKQRVSYLPDSVGFYDDLTGRQNLRYTAELNGIDPADAAARIDALLAEVGLTAAADRKVRTYSRGMRQRLGLADVLLKQPRIAILDEPTLGLDPQGAADLLATIRRLSREQGITFLLSSHLLHQVQQICDRVGIFVRGRLLACGPIDALADEVLRGHPLTLELECQPMTPGLRERLAALPGVESVVETDPAQLNRLTLRCTDDVRAAVTAAVSEAGAALLHLSLQGRTLDDIYRLYFEGGTTTDGDVIRKRAG